MSPTIHTRGGVRPLGEILVEKGLVTPQQLAQALAYKKQHDVRLGQAFVALEIVDEAQIAGALRSQGRIQCINLRPEIVNPIIAREMSEELCRSKRAIAINRIAGVTTVAMEDPMDVYGVDEIAMDLGTRALAVHAEPAVIEACLGKVFASSASARSEEPSTQGIEEIVEIAGDSDVDFDLDPTDADGDMGDEPDEGPVIKLLQAVLSEAFEAHASDIHIEPRTDEVVIRFRVDGSLFDRLHLAKGWGRPVLARLKVMSRLDIAQRRIPQDGRAQITVGGQRIDLRVATVPTLSGEGAVIRILDGGRDLTSLESLGLSAIQLERMRRAISCRDGFVLACGPTGSGKTTTLYGFLEELNDPDKKIITLEDPVENQIESVTQINVNSKIGLTFSAGLRSILRQDPDIVLLGEIRDEETAEIAVQAALTGHMVLSTLHTVGSAETITRLREMGVEHFLLADTLRGIIAQRLVRRICESCKRPVQPDERLLERLDIAGDSSRFYHGVGCETCHDTGFRGRVGLYEVLQMTPDICEALRTGCDTHQLRELASAAGMTTLREEGVQKARDGLTTLEEVLATTSRG